jgi:hypothetical protein
MSYPLFAIWILPFLLYALLGRSKNYIKLVLLLGGIPITFFMPKLIIPIGFNMNPQAAFLMIIILSSLILVFLNLSQAGYVLKKLWLWLLFLIYALISFTWSGAILDGFRFLLKLTSPLLMAVIVYAAIKSRDDVQRYIIRPIIAGGIIMLSLGVFNFLTKGAFDSAIGKILWASSTKTLVAPYMSPANYSFMLDIVLIVFLEFFFKLRKSNIYL